MSSDEMCHSSSLKLLIDAKHRRRWVELIVGVAYMDGCEVCLMGRRPGDPLLFLTRYQNNLAITVVEDLVY